VLAVLALASVGVQAAGSNASITQQAPIATEQLGGTLLTIQPSIRFDNAAIRVIGPDGFVLREKFAKDGSFTVNLIDGVESMPSDDQQVSSPNDDDGLERLTDGLYKYEVVFYLPSGDRRAQSGRFFVEAGLTMSREAKRSQLGQVRDSLEESRMAQRQQSKNLEGPGQNSYTADDFIMVDDNSLDNQTTVLVDADGVGVPAGFYWGMGNNTDSLELGRTSSPYSVTSPYLSVEVGGNVGIGTTAPSNLLHLEGSTRLMRMTGGADDVSLGIGSSGLWFYDDDEQSIVRFNHSASANTLTVDGDGLEVNAEKINLQSATGSTQVIVQENSGTVARRQLFRLENNGAPEFSLVDTDRALTWKFGTRSSSFEINRGGSGQTEFILRANGDLDIKGTLSQGSSRTLKKDFETLDSEAILDKVNDLPLLEWAYKASDEDDRHFGPMAEDFHATFGLGDNPERLAPGDAAGIALAAVQGLNRRLEARLDERDSEIESLRTELDQLKQLIQSR